MPKMNARADVLIVTVTKVESQAVMDVFQEAAGIAANPEPIGDRIYHNLGEVDGMRVFMAISEMGSAGLGGSAQTVSKAIVALSPRVVIMAGIAFGVNESKQAESRQRLVPKLATRKCADSRRMNRQRVVQIGGG